MQEIGEEFVEFLEKELNISDVDVEETKGEKPYAAEEKENIGMKESLDDIEAALSQLKKELGL